jgi:hypothetical protein
MLFSFGADVLGIGNIIGAVKNDPIQQAQINANAQIDINRIQANAQKQQSQMIALAIGGVLFLGLLYILLKD